MTVRIRRATPADAAVLAAMEAACFAEPWSAAAVARPVIEKFNCGIAFAAKSRLAVPRAISSLYMMPDQSK